MRYIFWLLLLLPFASAADIYVATTGSDTTGTGAIGAPYATITKGLSMIANHGDTVYVRGGTYYEYVELPAAFHGEAGSTTTLTGYPKETAIIDGTVALTGWTQCTEGTIPTYYAGNPTDLYWVTVPTTAVSNVRTFFLFEDGTLCRVCREPDQATPNGLDTSLFWLCQPETDHTTTTLRDDTVLTQADGYWTNAWLDIWSHDANNWILEKTITGFDAASNTLTLSASVNPIYADSTKWVHQWSAYDRYTLGNHPGCLDEAGEFYIGPVDGSNRKIYFIPTNVADLTAKIRYPSLKTGIKSLSGRNNYTEIKDLTIRGQVLRGVYWDGSGSPRTTNVKLDNLTINDIAASGGYGIYVKLADYFTIEDCTISRTGDDGIYAVSNTYLIIRNNNISLTAGTSCSVDASSYFQVIGNTIGATTGTHANGLSFYGSSTNRPKHYLVARNKLTKCVLTFQDSGPRCVYANLLYGDNASIRIRSYGDDYNGTNGYLVYLNNTSMQGFESKKAASLDAGLYDDPTIRYVVLNNLFCGMNPPPDDAYTTRGYNLFTAWASEQADHNLETGESYYPTLTDIFTDYAGNDYSLKAGSPVIAIGTSIASILTTEYTDKDSVTSTIADDFSGTNWPVADRFDFTKDIDGNVWGDNPAIGAYAYGGGEPPAVQTPSWVNPYTSLRVLVNEPFTGVVGCTNPNSGTLVYSATGKPSWMTLDTSTGALGGTPTQPGIWTIIFSATDGIIETPISQTVTVEVWTGTYYFGGGFRQ